MPQVKMVGLLVPLALVVGIIFFILRSRKAGGFSPRAPKRRHWITRLVCGTLGTSILISISVGTWKEVHGSGEFSKGVRVKLPARPVPPAPAKPQKIENGRFLIHFAVLEYSETVLLPIDVRTFDLELPKDRERAFRSVTELPGIKVSQEFRVGTLGWEPKLRDAKKLHIVSHGSSGVDVQTATSSSGHGSGLPFDERRVLGWAVQPSPRPLSLAAGPVTRVAHVYFITPLSADDPLQEVSIEEFTQWCAKEKRDLPYEETVIYGSGDDRTPAPAIRFIERFGLACLLLLAAAVLLTQLFVNRLPGMVGVVTLLVLSAGAIDRLVLGSHLSGIEPQHSLYDRLLGCAQVRSTFFFWKTAEREIEKAAGDDGAPGELRRYAREVLAEQRKLRDPEEEYDCEYAEMSGDGGYNYCALYRRRDGALIYGFFAAESLPLVKSASQDLVGSGRCIYFLSSRRDGLWIKGWRVNIEGDGIILGISSDGSFQKLPLTSEELQAIRKAKGAIGTSLLWEQKIKPALYPK